MKLSCVSPIQLRYVPTHNHYTNVYHKWHSVEKEHDLHIYDIVRDPGGCCGSIVNINLENDTLILIIFFLEKKLTQFQNI